MDGRVVSRKYMVLSFNPFRRDVRRHFNFQTFMDHGCCCGELTEITQATFEVTLAPTVEKNTAELMFLTLEGEKITSEMQVSVIHSDHDLACTCANSHKFGLACALGIKSIKTNSRRRAQWICDDKRINRSALIEDQQHRQPLTHRGRFPSWVNNGRRCLQVGNKENRQIQFA